ncbi:hypothetical protein NDU88_007734 [Pleurodeles waltl]|uniref:Uncharacterized protein n=1 Tax=Pleurodeles waltl TaxID=8319 RepID=A0AAV7RTV9_PLEWA|nr:hypothetical protein NDU88_007734 [Pleurodeles waltl]
MVRSLVAEALGGVLLAPGHLLLLFWAAATVSPGPPLRHLIDREGGRGRRHPGLLPAPGAADEPPARRRQQRRARPPTSGSSRGRVTPRPGDSALEAAAQRPVVGLESAPLALLSVSEVGAPPAPRMSAARCPRPPRRPPLRSGVLWCASSAAVPAAWPTAVRSSALRRPSWIAARPRPPCSFLLTVGSTASRLVALPCAKRFLMRSPV